jgi:hypothetical protein
MAAAWASSGLSWGGDYLQFRGPSGLGLGVGQAPPTRWSETQNVRWTATPPGAGNSSPIIAGEQIILAGYEGFNVPGEQGSPDRLSRYLCALDRKDGQLLWKTDVPARLPEQERIRDEHGYATNTPVCDGQRIYAFFGKSGAAAFDLAGKQLWSANLGEQLNGWGSAASPVLFENLLIVNASVESEQLFALDKATGREVWKAPGIKESWSTPTLVRTAAGKVELVVPIFRKLLGFDPLSGEQLWSCSTEIEWYMVPVVVAEKDVLYCIGGRSGGSLAVRAGGRGDVTGSHRLWLGKKGSNVSSPIFHQGHLYWVNDASGVVNCARAESGEIVYEERLPRAGQFYASPVLAGGNLYYLSRDGQCFVVAAKPRFELLATNSFGRIREVFNASPVALDGQLFIRSDRKLYCIG